MPLRTLRVRLLQPLAVAALLLTYLVASIGSVPSPRTLLRWWQDEHAEPLSAAHPAGIQRYICEDHGCGCANAVECWSHCCCYSVQERLVWALEQGVAPPPGLTFTDAQWHAAARAVDPAFASTSDCVRVIHQRLAAGIATRARAPVVSIAPADGPAEAAKPGDDSCPMCVTVSAAAPAATTIPVSSVVPARHLTPLQCKGVTAGAVVLPPPILTHADFWLTPPLPGAFLSSPAAWRAPHRALLTPTPPPRGAILT